MNTRSESVLLEHSADQNIRKPKEDAVAQLNQLLGKDASKLASIEEIVLQLQKTKLNMEKKVCELFHIVVQI